MARIMAVAGIGNRERQNRNRSDRNLSARSEYRSKLENKVSNDGTGNASSGNSCKSSKRINDVVVASVQQCVSEKQHSRFISNNKVTQLAQKFNSTALREKEKQEEESQEPEQKEIRPSQLLQRNRKQQLVDQQRDAVSFASRCGNNSGNGVKNTIRLFEMDSDRVNKNHAAMTTPPTATLNDNRFRSRRRMGKGNSMDTDTNKMTDEMDTGAIEGILAKARNRLKPSEQSKRIVSEDREKPTLSTVGDQSTTERQRCVSMLVKDTTTYASFDVRSLKNRPLSVAARHSSLESALNESETPFEKRACTPSTTDPTPLPPSSLPSPSLSKNASFLHRLRTCVVDESSGSRTSVISSQNDASSNRNISVIDTTDDDDVDGYSNIDELRRSFSSLAPSSSSSSSSCLPRSSITRVTHSDCYEMEEEDDDDGNVYDTVLYSELNVVRRQADVEDEYEFYHNQKIGPRIAEQSDDDEYIGSDGSSRVAYETISPLSYTGKATISAVDSDSSLEKANSLYETKETQMPTWSASYRSRNQTISTWNSAIARTQRQTGIVNAVENDCNNSGREADGGTDIENVDMTILAANSSASLTSDDWLDINERESAADHSHRKKIAIIKKRRIRLTKLRKLKRKKFRSHQNQQKISVRVGSASTIYIADQSEDAAGRCRQYQNESLRTKGDNRNADSVTVLRSVLYLLPKYEAQEISTLFLDSDPDSDSHQLNNHGSTNSKARCEEENSHDGNYSVDNFSEELCDDFDDTSSDDDDYTSQKSQRSPTRTARTRSHIAEKNFISSVPSQNIYEFMKKARKTMRKSWSSFNQQMRRSSVNTNTNHDNVMNKGDGEAVGRGQVSGEAETTAAAGLRWSTSDTRAKFANSRAVPSASGSVRWASFKTKLRPKYSTVSAANSSIFYLNPEDLRFNAATTNETDCHADAQSVEEKSITRRRRTTCVDLNSTRPRPSSPPPPPPCVGVDKRQCAAGENHDRDNQNQNDVSVGAFDVSRSPPSSSNSELNLSSCSDLRLRFADEPLYQFYAESIAQLTLTTDTSLLESYSNDSDGYEEIGSLTSRPSAMELITPSPNGHGQCRSLWCEVDEVKNSGFLETLSISRQKLQEAKFEVITSEASYYKSLSVLDKIFVNNAHLRDENMVCKNDWKILFGNVAAVRKCSQALLSDLEKCWQEDIMLSGLSNVIFEHASTNFKIFVKYCSNQIYIDRTLKKLREESVNFAELINKLEADPVCQSLTLHSFLMLPMQRITRMPLLVDAILSKLDPVDDQSDHKTFKTTLARLNKIVKDCNENARKFERYEEMLLISRQLEFSRKDVKMFSVASSSRWLVRSGSLMYLNPPDAKLTITRKLTKNVIKLYFFLFNDILVIAKKKSESSYAVVDYCLRNVLQICALEKTNSSTVINLYLPHRYLLLLTILENHEGKTVEMVLSCDSDSTRQRWLEASYSRLTSDNPEEKLYEEWDCPQVLAVHAYVANQPDELSLQNGDVVKVLKKTTDGWYHGERIRDGIIGWFPENHTIEIASQHTRAKNLKLRHRLLTLSADYLQNQQQK